jgi:predicted CoA-binding protein
MLTIDEILKRFHTVALVGLSSNKDRPSYGVAQYLKKQGYKVVPVNPNEEKILGLACYPSLSSLTEPVEIVDIFRSPDQVMEVVEEAIKIGAKVVWMQEGVMNAQAAMRARDAGLEVIMDMCMMKEHRRVMKKGK